MPKAGRIVTGLVVLLSCAAVRAQVGSTPDEWAARFLPEVAEPPKLPEYADAYERVAADLSAGLYRRGLSDLEKIDKPDAARVGLLRADALLALGDTPDALALLDSADLADNFDGLRTRATFLLDAGRWAEAGPLIDRMLAAKPTSYAARLLKGQSLEAAGDWAGATAAYHWFLDPPQDLLRRWQSDPESFESADDLTAFATALHRWATLTAAYKDAPQLNDTVLAVYTRAFDVVDRGNVAARLAAADFCITRGDTGQAEKLLDPVGKKAATNRAVLHALAAMGLASGNEGLMGGTIDKLRDQDPQSTDAALLEIVTMARTRSAAAAGRATRLYAKAADRPDVAGVAAALADVGGDAGRMDAILKAADRRTPAGTEAYSVAARLLEMAFQRDAAVRLLKTVVARTPWDPTAYHLLGDLYLNDGYNDQAHAALDQAFALDPYNVKTLNYIRLLDDLAKYDQRVSEHFIVYSDKDADPIAAEQIGAFMEQTYADVCKVFEYEPKTKVVVQIYPEDDSFSVRMAGVPGVENFGVSFGRVLATIAPRPGTKQGNFNFARVLKHEFVHTINLLQTNQRCPRWLTEGLAVWQEHVPFRFAGVQEELYKRTFDDTLFTIRGFPLAFIRPTRPGDGEQAYTQGAYLAMYMEETFGRESIVKLLNGYGRGLSDEDALAAATGEAMTKVEADWHAWMKTKLKPWGYDAETRKKGEALEKEGEQFLTAKNLPEAARAFQEASDLMPMAIKPHQRLAGLYLQKPLTDPAKAIENLSFLHFLQFQDGRYAKAIAKLYARQDDAENAAKWAREATYVDLYDAASHDLLADSLAKLGRGDEADAERRTADQVRLWEQKRKGDAN